MRTDRISRMYMRRPISFFTKPRKKAGTVMYWENCKKEALSELVDSAPRGLFAVVTEKMHALVRVYLTTAKQGGLFSV